MLTTLCVLAALLGLATALNLSLTFAVIRRLREIEERGGRQADRLPAVGTEVQDFEAETVTGEPLDRSAFSVGEALVAFVMVGCAPCAQLIEALDQSPVVHTTTTRFFVVGDPASAEARELAVKVGRFGSVALIPKDTSTGPMVAFGGVTAFPTLLRVRDGRIVAAANSLEKLDAPVPSPSGAKAAEVNA